MHWRKVRGLRQHLDTANVQEEKEVEGKQSTGEHVEAGRGYDRAHVEAGRGYPHGVHVVGKAIRRTVPYKRAGLGVRVLSEDEGAV